MEKLYNQFDYRLTIRKSKQSQKIACVFDTPNYYLDFEYRLQKFEFTFS